jgi:hypothetical protein
LFTAGVLAGYPFIVIYSTGIAGAEVEGLRTTSVKRGQGSRFKILVLNFEC